MRLTFRRVPNAYAALALWWVAVQALPWIWLANGRTFHAEVLHARKLLEYGFWARKGAMIVSPFWVGILPNPAEHNYVNHNYPIIWLFTLLYDMFGEVGVYVFVGVAGLAGLLMTYWILTQFFSRTIAWFTAALFACAHASVEFSVNPDMLAQGAIIWPLSCVLIVHLQRQDLPRRATIGFLLGLVVFLCGQINWFALSTIPALLVLCLPEPRPLKEALVRPWSVPGWIPVIVGGTASLVLFIGQVLFYSPNLHGNAQYLGLQMGAGSFISSRLEKLPVLLMRMVLAGPALWAGALVGTALIRSNSPNRRWLAGMLVYFGVFTAVMLTIPRLLFLNQHGFRYAVFPCALLTAFALSRVAAQLFRVGLAAVALPGLLFCYAKLHDYQVSRASMTMGRWLQANTQRSELVFSNLQFLRPPIKSWDGEFLDNTAVVADRLISYGVTNTATFAKSAAVYAQPFGKAAFLIESSQPLDPQFRQKLELEGAEAVTTNVAVPPESVVIFKTARAALWKLLSKHAPQYAPQGPSEASGDGAFHFRLFRLPPNLVREIQEGASKQPSLGREQ